MAVVGGSVDWSRAPQAQTQRSLPRQARIPAQAAHSIWLNLTRARPRQRSLSGIRRVQHSAYPLRAESVQSGRTMLECNAIRI